MLAAAELLHVRTRQLHQSCHPVRNRDIQLNRPLAVLGPGDRDLAVSGFEGGPRPLKFAARLGRNFAEADRIRKDLDARGIVLEDTGNTTRWKRK